MSRNGSGTYSLPAGNPVVSGTSITTTWANNTLTDIANTLTASVASDGQTPMTGALNMANNKVTSVTDPTNAQDAATKNYVDGKVTALGTMATQNANAVAITGGTESGVNIDNSPIGTTTRSTVKATTLDLGLSTQSVAIGQGNASIMKNRIINGAMVIDQRNAGASVTPTTASSFYGVDRFQTWVSQNSKLTMQQNAGSVTPPVGFSNYLGFTSSSAYAITSTDYFYFEQRIEGFNTADLQWGTANAKTATLSFQVYSSLTGTFGGSLMNGANTRSYPFSYSIPVANTWTTISITVAGDTSGTWVGATNGTGIDISWGLGNGSTRSNAAGAWATGQYLSATGATSVVGTSGATFYITGVQLEVGSSATGFEYVNYQTSLANCQRYAEPILSTSVNGNDNPAVIWTAARTFFNVPYKVTKRTTPSITNSSLSGNILYNGAAQASSTFPSFYPNTTACGIEVTTSGLTGGQAAWFDIVSGSLFASAEL